LHSRGRFSRELAEHGVLIRQACVEAPSYQIGKIERHGGVFKSMIQRIIKDNSWVGFKAMANAATITRTTKKSMAHTTHRRIFTFAVGLGP
jgi:hypothetical protein